MDYMTMNFNRNGGGGTSDYSQLTNKPSINDVTLIGNKTASDLGLMPEYDIDNTPTESSDNLITSGAVYEADEEIKDELQGSKTVSGNPLTVTDAEPMNAESVKVELEPKQDLHGYSKPWAGGAGKNKLEPFATDIVSNGITSHQNDGGSVTLNGTMTDSECRVTGKFDVQKDEYYALSIGELPTGVTDFGLSGFSTIKVIHHNADFQSAGMILYAPIGTTFTNAVVYPQIEQGSTATTFAPYSNICPISGYSEVNVENNTDTYTVSLGGTKYGGILDVTSGVLTVDRASVDLGSLTWELSSQNRWSAHIDGMKLFQNEQVTTAISDSFMATTMNQLYSDENYIGFATNSVSDVYIRNGDSVNEPTGQLVYELATPTQIQLTPTQVQMLENTNNISSDGTNITLKYQPNNIIGECKAYTDEQVQKVLPTPPTTDGTYHLECSVSGGMPTISWVSNS